MVVHGCGDDNRIAKEEVSIADIGMPEENCQATLEIEGATRRPYVIAETVEKNRKVTSAQAIHMARQ